MNAQGSGQEAFLPVLRLEEISRSFGGIQALNDVSFEVAPGAIHALIGPNGAGKTTLLNVITGSCPPDTGAAFLGDCRLNGRKPHERVSLGIARTFQNIELFGSMTVLENVLVGRHVKTRCGFFGAMAGLPGCSLEERKARQRAHELLDFVGLSEAADWRSTDLPFGWQRFLEIARALATGPKVLLLDEPASGLNPVETSTLCDLLRKIRENGVTLLLVEHDMNLVMEISDRVFVLNHGMKLADGTPCEIQANEAVISAYLGRERMGGKCSACAI
ncbi:MAG: ABC transporter ATP-binding protein [Desulfobacteraceae bacterium]|nr:ABC transporter ATP-binding protein [Desulfobacteraceae bacterium]